MAVSFSDKDFPSKERCKMFEKETCDAIDSNRALEMISNNTQMCLIEKDIDSNNMNNNYCNQESLVENVTDYADDIDAELSLKSKYGTQCHLNVNSKDSIETMQNLPLKKSSNCSLDLPLVSRESVKISNEFDSSALNCIDSSDLLLEKIDYHLQNETTPFHPDIANSIQELLIEMKVLLNTLKGGSKSAMDPVALSYITRCQVIREYLEKILIVEFQKLKDCKIKKRKFEEYAFCMKSCALKQDKIFHSVLEELNSCVSGNKTLYEQLCFLTEKLQSFGLLKPQTENDLALNKNILDVGKIPEDDISFHLQIVNDIPSDYMESLQIFKTSSTNLHTLNIQAKNLQLLAESSHKLSDNLISRIQDQELHMKGITKQLEKAHNLLATIKREHRKLQSAENIVKYDLQEKRKFLNKLKLQLEATRENCDLVRVKNSKSEAEWQDLRREFVQRNKQASEESGFLDDRGEEIGIVEIKGDESDLVDDKNEEICFNDEYVLNGICVADNIDCCPDELGNVPDSDISLNDSDIELKYELKRNRLQLLEEQCKILYNNLKNNANKGKELDYRFESWSKAVKSSRNVAAKNNFSVTLNDDKDNLDKAASRKININVNSDVESPLSSPEIGSFDSDSCSYIPQVSCATSKGLRFSLETFKTDKFASSESVYPDDYKLSFKFDELENTGSNPVSEELNDNCDSITTDNVQDSSYFGSMESIEESDKCQVECDSEKH